MRVLFTHRFFWPDTPPYAQMLHTIASDTVAAGHDVHIFTSLPSYRTKRAVKEPGEEGKDALSVSRCYAFANEKTNLALRVINLILYCVGLMRRIFILRPDVVTVSTYPPVFAAWCGHLACRFTRAKLIYHVQDIHPEVSEYSGGILGKAPLRQILRWFDNQTLRYASQVVVLSKDMASTLEARQQGVLPVVQISNFELTDQQDEAKWDSQALPEEYTKPIGCVRIIFAGNLGRFQNLHDVTAAIAQSLAKHENLELFFMGSGSEERALKHRWAYHPQIKFLPFLPIGLARHIISASDIGLVSLSGGISRVAYPSKIQTYLGCGLPVLLVTDEVSQISQDITDAKTGVASASSSAQDISDALSHLIADLALCKANVAQTKYKYKSCHILPQWREALQRITTD